MRKDTCKSIMDLGQCNQTSLVHVPQKGIIAIKYFPKRVIPQRTISFIRERGKIMFMVKYQPISKTQVKSRFRIYVPKKVCAALEIKEDDFISFEKNDRGEVVLRKMIVTYPDD